MSKEIKSNAILELAKSLEAQTAQDFMYNTFKLFFKEEIRRLQVMADSIASPDEPLNSDTLNKDALLHAIDTMQALYDNDYFSVRALLGDYAIMQTERDSAVEFLNRMMQFNDSGLQTSFKRLTAIDEENGMPVLRPNFQSDENTDLDLLDPIVRLFMYENTGLSPQDIENLKNKYVNRIKSDSVVTVKVGEQWENDKEKWDALIKEMSLKLCDNPDCQEGIKE